MKEKLDNIFEMVLSNQARLTRLEVTVSGLKTDNVGLKADVSVLKTDVAELKTDVAELKSDVAELKTDVAELKTDVAELKTRLSRLEERVGVLEQDVREIKLELVGFRQFRERANDALAFLIKQTNTILERLDNEAARTAILMEKWNSDRDLFSEMYRSHRDTLAERDSRLTNLESRAS